MTREVAAVDGGNVTWRQRRQRLRVVPVVEMAAMAFEGFHRAQRINGPLDELPGCDIAEVARAYIGEERQTHIGRRRAMGDRRDGVLLKIVRREPMIVAADKCLEVSPCAARRLAQKKHLVSAESRAASDQGPANPPADRGRCYPQQQYRECGGQRAG